MEIAEGHYLACHNPIRTVPGNSCTQEETAQRVTLKTAAEQHTNVQNAAEQNATPNVTAKGGDGIGTSGGC